jgi:ferritin-like metal-binding protein YciE
MSSISTIEDLLDHELKDLYSAESQLIKALPKMAKSASHPQLKKAIESHLKETQEQLQRLTEIGESMGKKLTGHTCKAMKGLLEEASEFIAEDAPEEVKDAGLIAQAQRVEHYEISGYGSARAIAERLGLNEVVKRLEKTLNEEKNADAKLNKLALSVINEKAAMA